MYYKETIQQEIEKYCKENDYTIDKFNITPTNGTWHPGFTGFELKYNQGTLRCSLTEMASGCGVVLFHHFSSSQGNTKAMLPILNILFKHAGDVGTVLATLGHSFDEKSTLIAWGFEPVMAYPNLRHGEKYIQTLYKKTIR